MITERDKNIWRAALTLAHNICIIKSNRVNDDDGPLDVVNATSDCGKEIKNWLTPSEEMLQELFNEAGVTD